MLRILLVSPLPPPAGGISTWTLTIQAGMKTSTDIAIAHVDSAVRWRDPVDVRLWRRLTGGSWQAVGNIWKLTRAIISERPTLVHLCTSGSWSAAKDLIMLAITKIYGLKCVFHYHTGLLPEELMANRLTAPLLKFGLRHANAVLVFDNQSEHSVRKAVRGALVQRIPNPIDVDSVTNAVSREPRVSAVNSSPQIVFVGHVVNSKGVRELVKACGMLARQHVVLNIVGEVASDIRKLLTALAKEYDGGQWLHLHGPLPWPRALAYMRDGDIVVLPSYTEAFPYVLLEAMALGKAIVATRVGMIPEMLGEHSPQPCGVLVEPRDVDGLHMALVDLLAHPEMRSQIGQIARQRVATTYSVDRIMAQYRSLWKTVHELHLPYPFSEKTEELQLPAVAAESFKDAAIPILQSDSHRPSGESLRVMLISPLPPPSGGIASWTASVLPRLRAFPNLEIVHIDTAVRWRGPTDEGTFWRIVGGTVQAARDIIRIRARILETKPHVLHLCTSGSLATLRDICILGLTRRYRVWSIIQYRMGRLPSLAATDGWEWRLTKKALKSADIVLLLDQESMSSARKLLPQGSLYNIPNPIDLEMMDRWSVLHSTRQQFKEPYWIVFVGHVIPSKGINELVEACLVMNDIEIELYLVGEVGSNYKKELERIGRQRADGRWLKILGGMDQRAAIRYIRDADVFVLPSHTEGFPNVVLEAMALAKAIVATSVGETPVMLDNDSDRPCGIVVAPGDVRGLHAALRELLTDPEKAIVYGKRARDKARRAYSIGKILDQYVALWQSVSSQKMTRLSGDVQ